MIKNNIKELSIQIHLNGLSFCILNKSSNTVELLKTIDFEQKLNPSSILNHLKEELSSNTIFSEDFDAVLVIHQNELSTLVPTELFDKNHKADYLKFNTKILRTDFITQDEMVVNDSINVYVPYVNINNYIFDTFGEFVYKHASTVLVENILRKAKTTESPEVYININSSTIELLVLEKKKLLLFNVFEYHSKEDFIYYVLFVFEQLQLDTETTIVNLSGSVNKNDDIYNMLYTYVRHIAFVDTDFSFKFSNAIDSENLHHHYLILNSF